MKRNKEPTINNGSYYKRYLISTCFAWDYYLSIYNRLIVHLCLVLYSYLSLLWLGVSFLFLCHVCMLVTIAQRSNNMIWWRQIIIIISDGNYCDEKYEKYCASKQRIYHFKSELHDNRSQWAESNFHAWIISSHYQHQLNGNKCTSIRFFLLICMLLFYIFFAVIYFSTNC